MEKSGKMVTKQFILHNTASAHQLVVKEYLAKTKCEYSHRKCSNIIAQQENRNGTE
jgi:hypothetical protein